MVIDAVVAAEYFAELWPLYSDQKLVEVEGFPFVRSCPFRGSVNWTGDGWHVLVDTGEGAREMFTTLCHELAHVRAGDVRPGMAHKRTVAQRRALALGQEMPAEPERKKHWAARVRGRAVYGERLERAEIDADAWGWQTADMAWTVLQERDSIPDAVAVMKRWG